MRVTRAWGSPISRPRQVANTRPCTARAHLFSSSFKTAFPARRTHRALGFQCMVAPHRTNHPSGSRRLILVDTRAPGGMGRPRKHSVPRRVQALQAAGPAQVLRLRRHYPTGPRSWRSKPIWLTARALRTLRSWAGSTRACIQA
jgi:hypothetical protein